MYIKVFFYVYKYSTNTRTAPQIYQLTAKNLNPISAALPRENSRVEMTELVLLCNRRFGLKIYRFNEILRKY